MLLLHCLCSLVSSPFQTRKKEKRRRKESGLNCFAVVSPWWLVPRCSFIHSFPSMSIAISSAFLLDLNYNLKSIARCCISCKITSAIVDGGRQKGEGRIAPTLVDTRTDQYFTLFTLAIHYTIFTL